MELLCQGTVITASPDVREQAPVFLVPAVQDHLELVALRAREAGAGSVDSDVRQFGSLEEWGARQGVRYVVGFAGDPFDLERVVGELFPDALEPWVGELKEVFLKDSQERSVVCGYDEVRKTLEVERALSDGVENGQALQFHCGVTLLRRGEGL